MPIPLLLAAPWVIKGLIYVGHHAGMAVAKALSKATNAAGQGISKAAHIAHLPISPQLASSWLHKYMLETVRGQALRKVASFLVEHSTLSKRSKEYLVKSIEKFNVMTILVSLSSLTTLLLS